MEFAITLGLGVLSAVVFYMYGRLGALTDSKTVASVEKYAEYKPYAMMAAKKVEEMIADDLGTDEKSSTVMKSLRKLDDYLKIFTSLVIASDSPNPTPELLAMAKAWSVELAEELNYKGLLKKEEAKDGDIEPTA